MGPASDPMKKGSLSQNRLSQLPSFQKHLQTRNECEETHKLDPYIKVSFRKTDGVWGRNNSNP